MRFLYIFFIMLTALIAGCGVAIEDFPGQSKAPPPGLDGKWIVKTENGKFDVFVTSRERGLELTTATKDSAEIKVKAFFYSYQGKDYLLVEDSPQKKPSFILLSIDLISPNEIKLISPSVSQAKNAQIQKFNHVNYHERGVMTEILFTKQQVKDVLDNPKNGLFENGVTVQALKQN